MAWEALKWSTQVPRHWSDHPLVPSTWTIYYANKRLSESGLTCALSSQVSEKLASSGICNIGQVLFFPLDSISLIRGIGPKSFQAIDAWRTSLIQFIQQEFFK